MEEIMKLLRYYFGDLPDAEVRRISKIIFRSVQNSRGEQARYRDFVEGDR